MRATLLLTLCLTAPIISAAETPLEKPSDADIRLWITQLGSDDFDTRASAELKLLAAGDAARVELESAAKSDDEEVRLRVARVLGRINVAPVLKQMAEARKNLKTYEADVKMTAGGIPITGHSKSSFTDQRYRLEYKHPDPASGIVHIKIVSDGTHRWEESSATLEHVRTTVKKTKLANLDKEHSEFTNGLDLMREMEEFPFTEATAAKIAGAEVHVLSSGALANTITGEVDEDEASAKV